MNIKYVMFCLFTSLLSSGYTYAYCPHDVAVTKPNSRYQILTSGSEVLDKKTNLIWQRCSLGYTWNGTTCKYDEKIGETTYTWQEALKASQALGNGYRLPNIKELESLAERSCSPMINEKMFPDISIIRLGGHRWVQFWSSSARFTSKNSGRMAYSFGYISLGVGSSSLARFNFVRPVRENTNPLLNSP
ncbi:Lcl C-terminal domain-containing protein [Psychrobacter sp. I-STPA10]|uniref:Lcl C-terminal domain-containing protein n=1 Tax=Psychrobacter sp. I-STPA10 TaxID=2585769 RepID=UPI001E3A98DA|nr:DUF1566 domain-containing protein [Psychrobacter sp. I-STPA10]